VLNLLRPTSSPTPASQEFRCILDARFFVCRSAHRSKISPIKREKKKLTKLLRVCVRERVSVCWARRGRRRKHSTESITYYITIVIIQFWERFSLERGKNVVKEMRHTRVHRLNDLHFAVFSLLSISNEKKASKFLNQNTARCITRWFCTTKEWIEEERGGMRHTEQRRESMKFPKSHKSRKEWRKNCTSRLDIFLSRSALYRFIAWVIPVANSFYKIWKMILVIHIEIVLNWQFQPSCWAINQGEE
jgi:hypothetical protein